MDAIVSTGAVPSVTLGLVGEVQAMVPQLLSSAPLPVQLADEDLDYIR